jgi:hypothetical protein
MRYEFTFTALVTGTVLTELPELTRSAERSRPTTLYGPVEDAAHLHGLVTRFHQLGLEMTDMHRLPD